MKRTLLPLLLAVATVAAASCSAPSKGAIILAITTDMQAPKDVDVVSVYVTTDNVPKFDYLGRVSPEGTVYLPSTLAIVEPDNPSAEVRIRVIAFKTQPDGSAKARVLRDVLTTVPHQRTALLRMPLNFLDDGSASGSVPAMFVPGANDVPEGPTSFQPTDPTNIQTPDCDFTQGMTSIAGTCQSATVDSTKIPDYSDDGVFGEGGTSLNPACFDVTKCIPTPPQQPDPQATHPVSTIDMTTCSFQAGIGESGQNWNCALATTDGTGTCVGAGGGPPCFVPLESDPGEGFTVQPSADPTQPTVVAMVPGVCKKLGAGATLYVNPVACATKVEASPVCQPGEAVADSGAADGGAVDGAPVSCDGMYTVTCSGVPCVGTGCATSCGLGGPPQFSVTYQGNLASPIGLTGWPSTGMTLLMNGVCGAFFTHNSVLPGCSTGSTLLTTLTPRALNTVKLGCLETPNATPICSWTGCIVDESPIDSGTTPGDSGVPGFDSGSSIDAGAPGAPDAGAG